MKNIRSKSTKGITLIALVVTVVVTIIIAAISISVLTGDNGTINNAQKAKEDTEIAEEKEILTVSAVQAAGKDTYGNVEEDNLREQLDKNVGEYELEKIGDNFKVTFPSDRSYIVDGAGKVIEISTENTVELAANMSYDSGKYYIEVQFAKYQLYGDFLKMNSDEAISGVLIDPSGDSCDFSIEKDNDNSYYRYEVSKNGEYKFSYIGDDGSCGEITVIIDDSHPQIVSDRNHREYVLMGGLGNFISVNEGSLERIYSYPDGEEYYTKRDITSDFMSNSHFPSNVKGIDLRKITPFSSYGGEITFVYEGKEIKRKLDYWCES